MYILISPRLFYKKGPELFVNSHLGPLCANSTHTGLVPSGSVTVLRRMSHCAGREGTTYRKSSGSHGTDRGPQCPRSVCTDSSGLHLVLRAKCSWFSNAHFWGSVCVDSRGTGFKELAARASKRGETLKASIPCV